MKFLVAAAAGVAALLVVVPAEAQTTRTTTTTTTNGGVVKQRTVVRHNGNGWHGRTRWQTKCRTWWRHGHKYRTCRKVRVRW